MVGAEGELEIRVLHRRGKGIREIARETGIARNAVRLYRFICVTNRRGVTSGAQHG